MTQDLSGYNADYYTRDRQENLYGRSGLLRPDQFAALCYAMGWWFRNTEHQPGYGPRAPGLVVSVGAGKGELEARLETMPGVTGVLGVDPSAGSRELYLGSRLVPAGAPEDIAGADTVIFCESLEHIPPDQSQAIIAAMKPGSRLIIVNWWSYHPIHPDGFGKDHITLVDDALFDSLSEGRVVQVRWGSHLVLDMP